MNHLLQECKEFLKSHNMVYFITIGTVVVIVGTIGWIMAWNFFYHENKPSLPKKNDPLQQVTAPIPLLPYEIVSGQIEMVDTPAMWKHINFETVLKGKAATILLPTSNVKIEFTGKIGILAESGRCFLLDGKARFNVTPQPQPFRVVSRVGEIYVLGTEFEAELQQQVVQPPKMPEDGSANLILQVYSGKVAMLPQGQKVPQAIVPGKPFIFSLSEVRTDDTIQAIGLSEWNASLPAGRAKLMQKQGADVDLRRSIQEFISGMEFTATKINGQFTFSKAEFRTSGHQAFSLIPTYDTIEPLRVLVAKAEIRVSCPDAQKRRYCKPILGKASISREKYPNFSMAVRAARTQAILNAINMHAIELYGNELPQDIRGIFYPQAFNLESKGTVWEGVVQGEVVLD